MNSNRDTSADRGDGQPAATGLTAEELRVLACLIEKSQTTPEQYPLSTNALTAACNQKTSREPIVDYSFSLVDRVLQLLRDGGLARSIRGAGNRTFKHRHVIDERLNLGEAEQALIAVLALRGPQSPGELKTRTERYHPFTDLDDVERVLAALASRQPPLVRDLGRGPGQSQNRWEQLLGQAPGHDAGGAAPANQPAAAEAPPGVPTGPEVEASTSDRNEVAELRARVEQLEARLATLEGELGLGS